MSVTDAICDVRAGAWHGVCVQVVLLLRISSSPGAMATRARFRRVDFRKLNTSSDQPEIRQGMSALNGFPGVAVAPAPGEWGGGASRIVRGVE